MSVEGIFEHFWNQYTQDNPAAKQIHDLFEQREHKVINDHIALRTLNDRRVCVDRLAQPFLDSGYVASGDYQFVNKKLVAKHFEHPDPLLPKVFISELLLEAFTENEQLILRHCIDKIHPDVLDSDELLVSGISWGPLSHEIYLRLLQESEYAAWFYAYGYRANHFTVSVNHLNTFDSLESVNGFLKDKGFKLNPAGGEIKGTKSEFLEQSSTLAENKIIHFIEGDFEIPSCYYEFARRYEQSDGSLYQGFVAASADKIFESTNTQ